MTIVTQQPKIKGTRTNNQRRRDLNVKWRGGTWMRIMREFDDTKFDYIGNSQRLKRTDHGYDWRDAYGDLELGLTDQFEATCAYHEDAIEVENQANLQEYFLRGYLSKTEAPIRGVTVGTRKVFVDF